MNLQENVFLTGQFLQGRNSKANSGLLAMN